MDIARVGVNLEEQHITLIGSMVDKLSKHAEVVLSTGRR